MVLIIRTDSNVLDHRASVVKASNPDDVGVILRNSGWGLYANHSNTNAGFSFDGKRVFDTTRDRVTINVENLTINSIATSDTIIFSNSESKTVVNGNYVYEILTLHNQNRTPDVSNLIICDNDFNPTEQLALQTQFGYLQIEGREFEEESLVAIDSIPFNSSVVSQNILRVETSNLMPGFRELFVISPSGAVSNVITIPVSDGPVLPNTILPISMEKILYSHTLTANSDSAVTFSSITQMPPGIFISPEGNISGLVANIPGDTTFNFTIRCTDQEKQFIDAKLNLFTRKFFTGREMTKSDVSGRFQPTSLSINEDGNFFAVAYAGSNTVCLYTYSNGSWSNHITLTQATIPGFGKWIQMHEDQVFVLADNELNVYDVSASPVKRKQTVSLSNTLTIGLSDDASVLVQATTSGAIRLFYRNAVNTYVFKKQLILQGEFARVIKVIGSSVFVTTITGTLYGISISPTTMQITAKYIHNTEFDEFGISFGIFGERIVVGVPLQKQVYIFDKSTFEILQVIPNFTIPGFGSSIDVNQSRVLINGQSFVDNGGSLSSETDISPPGVTCVSAVAGNDDTAVVFNTFETEPVNVVIARVFVKKFSGTEFVTDQNS